MKHLLRISLITALFAICALGAWSQVRYEIDSEMPISEVSEMQGKVVALKGFRSGLWMNGLKSTSSIGSDAAFVLEESDTEGRYYLKSDVKGLYLESPQIGGGAIAYTDSKLRAATIALVHPVTPDEPWEEIKKSDELYNKYDWSQTSIDDVQGNNDQVFMIVARFPANDEYNLLIDKAGNTQGPQWHRYVNFNTWYIYSVKRLGGFDLLADVFAELFPNSTIEGMFSVGDGVGQTPQKYVDELQKVFDEANEVLDKGVAEDAYCEELVKRLNEALKACRENFNPLQEGYYTLRSTNRAEDCMMKAGTDNMLWDNHTVGEELVIDDMPYVWHFIKDKEVKNGFKIESYSRKLQALSLTEVNFNVALPLVKDGDTYIVQPHSQSGFMGIVDPKDKSVRKLGMHADGHKRIVKWYADAGANAWIFNPVSEEVLSKFEDQLDAAERLKEAKKLLPKGMMALSKGKTYKSEATVDGDFSLMGLIPEVGEGDAARIWSNAPEDPNNEGGNGKIQNLTDNDFLTYFHSCWSKATPEYKWHNLCADLGEAVEAISIKYSRRHNTNGGSPTFIHVYATNDTTGCRVEGEKWVDQGYMSLPYNLTCEVDGSERKGFAGISGVGFDKPYRFVRFDVEKTESNARTNGNLYFYFSEMRYYKGEYDAENSLINAVPKEVIANLQNATNAIKEAIEAEEVSQVTIDEFNKAYDEFMKNFPDPQRVKKLLNEARAQAEHAVEGEDLGYFENGAKEALESDLQTVEGEVKDVMTVEEIEIAIGKINDALKAFNEKLIKPVDGQIYHIQCATSDEANNARSCFWYARDNSELPIRWGGYSQEDGEDPNLGSRLEFFWKVEKNEDGTFNFRNVGRGTYMGAVRNSYSTPIPMSYADTANVVLRSAKEPGLFNIVMAENVYANASPSWKSGIVSWKTANGADNSAFRFMQTAWDDALYVSLSKDDFFHSMTLPFDIEVLKGEIGFYTVKGYFDGKLQLTELEDGYVIKAGTPFIYRKIEEAEATSLILSGIEELSEIKYNFDVQNANGLIGVLKPEEVGENAALLFNGAMLCAKPDSKPTANTSYLDVTKLPKVNESGDAYIVLEEKLIDIISGIETIEMEKVATNVVYDMHGRRVKEPTKGIYIVNGKKIIK